MSNKRLFIVTGDYSGDIHAGHVVQTLKKIDPDVIVAAVGGQNLKKAGGYLLEDQSQMGRVGFGSVLGAPYHMALGRKVMKFLKDFNPDAVLLIDYGVFNLWLSGQLKKQGYKVYYFIPPQVWASRKGRMKTIEKNIDHVFCIFPFEEIMYNEAGIPATYVGHPLTGELPPPADKTMFCQRHGLDPKKRIVGIFPGSRKMEVDYLLEPLLGAAPKVLDYQPDTQFVLAHASSLEDDYFNERFGKASAALEGTPVKVIQNENHAILSVSDVILAASGTVTLEAALYKTPMVIVYKGHPLVYQVIKRVLSLPCIGLPNIINDVNYPIVPELWQDEVSPAIIAQAAKPFFDLKTLAAQNALKGFYHIIDELGQKKAMNIVASQIYQRI